MVFPEPWVVLRKAQRTPCRVCQYREWLVEFAVMSSEQKGNLWNSQEGRGGKRDGGRDPFHSFPNGCKRRKSPLQSSLPRSLLGFGSKTGSRHGLLRASESAISPFDRSVTPLENDRGRSCFRGRNVGKSKVGQLSSFCPGGGFCAVPFLPSHNCGVQSSRRRRRPYSRIGC